MAPKLICTLAFAGDERARLVYEFVVVITLTCADDSKHFFHNHTATVRSGWRTVADMKRTEDHRSEKPWVENVLGPDVQMTTWPSAAEGQTCHDD